MAATIFYKFSGGTGSYTAELLSGTTAVVDSQTHISAGAYNFTGVTDGTYDIRIRDVNNCLIQSLSIVVNCNITTTTTTTTSTSTTTTIPPIKPKVFFAVNSLNIVPAAEVTNNGLAGATFYASGETLQVYWTTDSGNTQSGTGGAILTSNVVFDIEMVGDIEVNYVMGNNSANISGLDSAGTDLTGLKSYSLDSGSSEGYFEFIIGNSVSPTQKNFQINIDISGAATYELGTTLDTSDSEYDLKSIGSFTNGYVTFTTLNTEITGKFD